MLCRTRLLSGLVFLLSLPAPGLAADKVLFEKQSPYSTVIVTEDEQGLRTLQFERDGVRQSMVKVGDPDHIELPYLKTMLAGLAFVEKPRRMLIVGLGGGSLPGILHRHYPASMIDVVDIDPVVVEVARDFFGFREGPRLQAWVQDGRRFIQKCRDPYELIFLDAFSAEEIPYHLATREFLEAARRATAPGGAVVANVWSRASNPLYDSMVRTYRSVFGELHILDVRGAGNRILVALPKARPIEPDKLVDRARAISRAKGLRFDLGDLVDYGLDRQDEIDPAASVLLDQPTMTCPTTSTIP